eukprot:3466300-Lingulodinium_polyedra.AAC.1
MKKRMQSRIEFVKPPSHPPISKETKKERLQWAHETQAYNWDWDRCVFVDETHFKMGRKGGVKKMWRIKGSDLYRPYLHQEGQGFTCIIAFSASKDRPTKMLICKGATKEVYTDFLGKLMSKRKDPIHLMHDNAPGHRARLTKKFCKDRGIILVGQPPYSPDTQPVEEVIAWLKGKVYGRNKVYSSIDELKKAVEVTWDQFKDNQSLKLSFARSMPKKIQRVIDAGGGWPSSSA